MDLTERKLRELEVHRGLIIDVHVDSVRLPNGSQARREIVRHPGGVAVLPLDEAGNVYCVRQYRYAFSRALLEIPAGKLEKGEDALPAARRELEEETGISAGQLDSLGCALSSPGFCDEVLHLYLARELHFGAAHPDEDELLHVEKYSLTQLVDMAMSGELTDAKTVIAVLKTARLLETEKE